MTKSSINKNANPNRDLWLKFTALSCYCPLQINGQSPNAGCTVGQYLMSGGDVVIDLSALDPLSRHNFEKWLINPHMNDGRQSYWHGAIARDYRGYTTEAQLSWWGRILNFLYYRRPSQIWSFAPLKLSLGAQLHSFSITKGENGLLFGCNILNLQQLLKFTNEPDEERVIKQNNSKRIIITPQLVKTLTALDWKALNADKLLHEAHPLSITVPPHKVAQRQKMMDEYRQTELYESTNPWYRRLWLQLLAWLEEVSIDKSPEPPINQAKDQASPQFKWFSLQSHLILGWKKTVRWLLKILQQISAKVPEPADPKANYSEPLLDKTKEAELGLRIFYDPEKDKVLVIEEVPPVDTMIYAGGGSKIFTHIGVNRALEQMDIKCRNFAGSSAGAIMAMLGYLGYDSTEIHEFFQSFSREVIVHYNISWEGLSHSRALKAAFDYAINKKVLEIIKQYRIEDTAPGRIFLENEVFPEGKITFRSLQNLKQRYPDCMLGDCLKITGTNVRKNKTVIFSASTTPDEELSKMVTISASMPGVFQYPRLNGEPYSDGGLLRNFPIELFPDSQKTLLSSRYGNNLSTLGVCFNNNGVEHKALNNFRTPLHKDSAFKNWLNSLLTGIKDTASGWRMDLIKLTQYRHQVVVIPANISSTNFNVKPAKQQELMRTGYYHTMRHLHHIYDTETKQVAQAMYANYNSLEEVMVHCALRGRRDLFELLKPVALSRGVDSERLEKLENSHFLNNRPVSGVADNTSQNTSRPPFEALNRCESDYESCRSVLCEMRVYDVLYPIFLRINRDMFGSDKSFANFKAARHHLSPHSYVESLEYLSKNTGSQHLLLYLVQEMMRKSEQQGDDFATICSSIEAIGDCLGANTGIGSALWFYPWQLSADDTVRVIGYMQQENFSALADWMQKYQDENDIADFSGPCQAGNGKISTKLPDNPGISVPVA